jgi:hypothetical protein
VDPSPSEPNDVLEVGAVDRAVEEELEVVRGRSRVVDARRAPWEERTPSPPPPTPALDPPLADPVPLLPELLKAEDNEAAVLDDDPPEPLDPDDEPLLLPPPPLLPLSPPPPLLRPMAAPPPAWNPRLPRICGPRIVTNFSGPVVPVSLIAWMIVPPATVDVRIVAVGLDWAAC